MSLEQLINEYVLRNVEPYKEVASKRGYAMKDFAGYSLPQLTKSILDNLDELTGSISDDIMNRGILCGGYVMNVSGDGITLTVAPVSMSDIFGFDLMEATIR